MPTVKYGDCTIWYETRGSGPPVVMVYGIGGSSARWWDEFPRRLAERYQLVMLDNRGTGNSDRPEDAWTMADMTGDVHAVVADAGLDSFHLLGCSLGTIIARHYVLEHGGDGLRSLSLLCPPNGIQATPEDMQTALFWDPNRPLIESARASWPIVHPEPWCYDNDALLEREFEEMMRNPTPARTFQFQLAAAMAAPGTEDDPGPNTVLNRYAWPVLVAHGTQDRLVPPENAVTLHAAVPRSRLEMIENASHNFWQHAPERAAEIVLSFLDEAEAAAGGVH